MVGCVSECDSPWFVGKYGFILQNPAAFLNPIPCKGALGFWDVPERISSAGCGPNTGGRWRTGKATPPHRSKRVSLKQEKSTATSRRAQAAGADPARAARPSGLALAAAAVPASTRSELCRDLAAAPLVSLAAEGALASSPALALAAASGAA
jgi:hypothetical protein